MLRNGFAIMSLMVGVGLATAPVALADPPYRICTEATPTAATTSRRLIRHIDRRDRDGDGLACEPYKGRS